MKTKYLPLTIITTLLLGIHSAGGVNAATVHTKTDTITTKVVSKSIVKPLVKVPAHNIISKSTFKPLVTKPAPKPTVDTKITSVSKASTTKATSQKSTVSQNAAIVTKHKIDNQDQMNRIENTPDVRVLLGNRKQDATVSSSSGVTVLNSHNSKVTSYKVAKIGVRGSKIAVNGKTIDSVVTLKPINGNSFTFEGKSYRGGLTLRASNGTMMVINAVPLESYLYGVVPQEGVPSWPAAAL